MTKTEILKWRLTKLPTSDEVLKLLNEKLISKEEAREILFSTEKQEERDEASLKAEIKFLRELVEKLANKKSDRIVEVIREIEKPYYRWEWHKPYMYYCNGTTGVNTSAVYTIGNDSTTLLTSGTGSTMLASANSDNCAFSAIKTF